MESRTGASGNEWPACAVDGATAAVKSSSTPPPDHADYVEARANGLRATRERRERRRRKS